MDFKIDVNKPWRYRDRKRGMQELAAGTYDVPEQVTREVAELAIAQGMATKWIPQLPVAVVQAVAQAAAETPASDEKKPTRRKRNFKKRGPSPEDKSLKHAPENKSLFH